MYTHMHNRCCQCNAGTGHIRFWSMARTFTGLKLQGSIGKFGNQELSDVSGFTSLPDGKASVSAIYLETAPGCLTLPRADASPDDDWLTAIPRQRGQTRLSACAVIASAAASSVLHLSSYQMTHALHPVHHVAQVQAAVACSFRSRCQLISGSLHTQLYSFFLKKAAAHVTIRKGPLEMCCRLLMPTHTAHPQCCE